MLAIPLLLVACNNDDVGDVDHEESIIEPHASVGEPVVYRGGVGTEAEWEMRVVADGIECGIDVGDEFDEPLGGDRFCAVALTAENIGQEPNTEEFFQNSTLITDSDEIGVAAPGPSEAYRERHDLDPLIGVIPGESAESSVVFNVPEGAEPTQLHLQAGTDDEFVLIDLRD
jgi:hypothetical protein